MLLIIREKKGKTKINMTTKDLSKKQIIVPMSNNNINIIVLQTNIYISNINKLLKDVKSKVFANFIYSYNKGVVITTNKIAVSSNINVIEKYIKELNNINSNDIMCSYPSQSKSYLRILEVLYYSNNTFSSITYDQIKEIIKETYLFNNVVLAFQTHIIKTSPKSNIAII